MAIWLGYKAGRPGLQRPARGPAQPAAAAKKAHRPYSSDGAPLLFGMRSAVSGRNEVKTAG